MKKGVGLCVDRKVLTRVSCILSVVSYAGNTVQ